MPPEAWYEMYVKPWHPELAMVGMCVLSQVISASSCGRNWSAHGHVQTKICNKLSLKQLRNLFMSTRTAKWRQLSATPTSSRCLLGIMKMCSLCRLCGVAPALRPARPGPVRLTPADPRNYRIAESPNRRGAHLTESRIARRCRAIRRN